MDEPIANANEPAAVEVTAFEPAGVEPAGVEPAGVEPAGVEPAGVGPAVAGPAVAGPAVAGPAVAGPAVADASPGAMLRQAGPRIVRDVLGPTLTFYAGYKLLGLLAGIALASVFALGAFAYERHHGRPGIIARVVLGFVVLQAIIGVIAHSATIYLAQPVLLEGAQALVWLGSVAIGKPIASLFAGELFNFPDEVRASETYRQVFSRVSLTFGCYFAVAGCIQLVVLLAWGVDTFVVLRVASSIGLAGLIAWAVHYAFATFRASEWGPLLTPGPVPAD